MLGFSIASQAIAAPFRRAIRPLDNDSTLSIPVHQEGRVQAQYAEQNSIKPTRG